MPLEVYIEPRITALQSGKVLYLSEETIDHSLGSDLIILDKVFFRMVSKESRE
jgi:hypothetical protein